MLSLFSPDAIMSIAERILAESCCAEKKRALGPCTIVIDGFPNTNKNAVARELAHKLRRRGLPASVRYDVPSETVFDGGLLDHSSAPWAVRIHQRFVQAREKNSPRCLRSHSNQVLVTVRDSGSLCHTRAHLATLKNDAIDLIYRDDIPPLLTDVFDQERTLRYYLSESMDQVVENHLQLYTSRKHKTIRPKIQVFSRALALEFIRQTNGVYCDSSGFPYDPSDDLDKVFPSQNRKLVMHHKQHSDWTAHLIKQDVMREFDLGCPKCHF